MEQVERAEAPVEEQYKEDRVGLGLAKVAAARWEAASLEAVPAEGCSAKESVVDRAAVGPSLVEPRAAVCCSSGCRGHSSRAPRERVRGSRSRSKVWGHLQTW